MVRVKSQNITFLATRIGRFSISIDSAWFLDNAVCVVAYKMTSTNTSGLFGRVGEFNVERETFSAYVERMEMFFTANNIVETTGEGSAAANQLVANRKRAIFLTEVGPEAYSTLSNLLAPAKPKDTLFTDIVRILEKHYNPKPLEIAQSFHFGTRNQKSEESVSDYVLALKKLAVHCNYGEYLNRALRDRFVCGLNNPKIQNKLLNTEDLTFEKACSIAKTMEMADRNTHEFHPSRSDTIEVNKLTEHGRENINKNTEQLSCPRCGGSHSGQSCKFKSARCYKCSKVGHLASVCRSKDERKKGRVHKVHVSESGNDECENDDELGIYCLYSLDQNRPNRNRYTVEMIINGKLCMMELDTAADFSIMSKSEYLERFADEPLTPSQITLKTYTGEVLDVSGEMHCDIVYNGKQYCLPILVANYDAKPTLLGKNWLRHIKIEWGEIFCSSKGDALSADSQLNDLLSKHSELFTESYEGMKGLEAHITMRNDARPTFVKARRVPYALKEQVERELDKLEKNGVIKKTDRSCWASPVVVVPKADGTVRICGDYKSTINQSVEDEQYVLPTTQDLYTALVGSKVFSKLDLSHAYAQLNVDKESQEYLTIATHKGLYSYLKLPYGVKSSPKIFQAKMDQILLGVEKCVCKQDDILIGGNDWQENLKILADVLDRLHKYNLHLKLPKCEFLKPEVVYLGLRISADGLQPVEEKINAVKRAPAPQNVSELRSFLGMVQYYHSFLPGLATILAPLHRLLQKNVRWEWTNDCQKAFEACKEGLTSDSLLVHYDLNRTLRLACDASSYGLGAVLSHVMEDGQERPIAYASRTLSSSEKNYAQIEREALSIIFGVKKFHQFLYGRKFTLVTDHQPLLTILGPKTAIPPLAAARMQRWAIVLSAYDYQIEYRSSAKHSNCDALSRLPHEDSKIGSESEIYSLSAIDKDFPITAMDIGKATLQDPVLSKVHDWVMMGWPEASTEDFRPYHTRRNELSCEQNCILWGSRVIMPQALRGKMLKELHWEHPGVCAMKALARTCVWWPKMDEEIEREIKLCSVCQNVRSSPPSAPLIPWKWATRPFQRIHIDFCQKGSDYFLVVIDSHSKWIEVQHMTSITTEKTINELRLIFAQHGLPEEVVSDNGPQFVSNEFAEFMHKNGIKHTLTPPYHPQSNGAAERAVRVVKEALVKQVLEGNKSRSIKHRLADFLLRYRTTPHSTTGAMPAELLMRRRLRTRLSLVKPDLAQTIESKQNKQKKYKDFKSHQDRLFVENDIVRVRNTQASSNTERWILGRVVKVCGPRTYLVKTGHKTRYVHVDHLIKAHDKVPDEIGELDIPVPELCDQSNLGIDQGQSSTSVPQPPDNFSDENNEPNSSVNEGHVNTPSPAVLRRSERVRKPVVRLNL